MKYVEEKFNKIGDDFIDKCKDNLLTKNDLKLLNLFFNETPTQDKLDSFLSTYDIEVAGGYKALMLSYFMRMHPELNFTNYETPRLKGLFNFYRFQNMKLISYLMKIGKIFNENDVPMLVLKGFAMKCLRPDLSRAMNDIDILVPENKFLKAIEICKNLGYRFEIYVHSIDIHEPSSNAGIMDIHRYIDMKNKKERPLNKWLFKRARKSKYNGIDIYIPSNEDLLFLLLINLAINLEAKSSKASTLYVLFDCKYLLEQPEFNWNIVIQNIKLTKTQREIAFAIKFINSIVPNLIPSQLYNHPKLNKQVNNRCIHVIFLNYFLALQRITEKKKFRDVLNKQTKLKEYIKIKLYYKFCKFLLKKDISLLQLLIIKERESKRKLL